ncbi:hypothetical protein LOD99_10020 [Oopsacas minuta]|uniref:Uncharacterized protein n=1 Tax=Oopsacas minuta TaxID=111878 RepID=A0AAV7KJB7_9METZ|nr:hypothetical protein LOD99_10020 [Oopsacas minuta]
MPFGFRIPQSAHINYNQVMNIKSCIVGDSDVGKSSLLISYTTKKFPSDNTPAFWSGVEDYTIDGIDVSLSFWDTFDHENSYRLKPLSYRETDVLLILFSLINHISFENVKVKWNPEVMYYCPHTPKILVGTKLDLRDDGEITTLLENEKFAPISYSQGVEMMRDIGAVSYFECSALTQIGVTQVFEEAMRVAIAFRSRVNRRGRCILI